MSNLTKSNKVAIIALVGTGLLATVNGARHGVQFKSLNTLINNAAQVSQDVHSSADLPSLDDLLSNNAQVSTVIRQDDDEEGVFTGLTHHTNNVQISQSDN